MKNRAVARKSLVAARKISESTIFTSDNIAVMRPGSGLSPFGYWDIQGKKSENQYKVGDLIDE